MSELQFPKYPTVGQEYNYAPYKYRWDGIKWKTIGVGYNPVNDLRDEVLPTTREAIRRSYAEAGLNLVDGSFEEGGTLASANDVLLHKTTGKAYAGAEPFPQTVAAGTNPVGDTNWKTVTDELLRSDLSSSSYQFVAGSENLPAAPDKLVYGPGKVTINGKSFENLIPGLDILHSSAYMVPEDAIYGAGIGFPTSGGIGNFNFVLSIGAHPEIASGFNRSTAYGTNNFTKPIQIDRCEAFGNSALMFMRYGERNTMLGSIAGQWLGTNDPAGDGHEMWSNAGGYVPGQPGWDYGGFETANPGIGAKIVARTDYATASDQCARNVGIGRDAFNGSVKLMNCTAVGYRALASAYFVDNSSAFGTDAFRSGLFLNNSLAAGFAAGTAWQEGDRNTVLGVQAGIHTVKGDRNTLLGAFAGSDALQMNDCLFIGVGAGNDVIATTPVPSNILASGNDVAGVGSPLIVGNMALPKVGINMLPEKMAGTLHVRTSEQSASPVAPSGSADDFILESSGNTGMTFRSGATSLGAVNFASPTQAAAGGVIYNHSTSELTIRAANADKWKVTSASFNPAADNTQSVGTSALRASVIYAGTGAINTSDAREKTAPLAITDAVLDAWGDVQIITFQWLESIRLKGDEARWHFGVIAQQVRDAFSTHGLDGCDYGLLCYDEWGDELEDVIDDEGNKTGEQRLVRAAGNRWGIRPDQCLFLEAAYQRRRCDRIEARLSAAGL